MVDENLETYQIDKKIREIIDEHARKCRMCAVFLEDFLAIQNYTETAEEKDEIEQGLDWLPELIELSKIGNERRGKIRDV